MEYITLFTEPWSAQMSKKHGCKYYFETKKNLSNFTMPDEAMLDMVSGFLRRVIWNWDSAAGIILKGHPDEGLSRSDMEEYIRHNIARR